jgi:hypothetical protein
MRPKGRRNPSEHLPLFFPPTIFSDLGILLSVTIIRGQKSKPRDIPVILKFFWHLSFLKTDAVIT